MVLRFLSHAAKKFTFLLLLTMIKLYARVILLILGAFVGTGAYILAPSFLYALIGLLMILLAFNLRGFGWQNRSGITSASFGVLGLLRKVPTLYVLPIYISFLLLNLIRDVNSDVSRLYVNFFLGLFVYLLIQVAYKLNPNEAKISFLPILAMAMIAIGLVLEMLGVIDVRGLELGGEWEDLIRRPGGFLNPNMTAAIVLIWCYVAQESNLRVAVQWRIMAFISCGLLLLVTQSRAAVLAFALYMAVKVYEYGIRSTRYLLLGGILALFFYQLLNFDFIVVLYDSLLTRFDGDASSVARLMQLDKAVSLFYENPLLGYGMRGTYIKTGIGTHNEVIEWLLNFGLVGFFVGIFLFLKFYYVHSLKYLLMCLFPTLMFSHNFFETTAFQVSLAFAYCLRSEVDRGGRACY